MRSSGPELLGGAHGAHLLMGEVATALWNNHPSSLRGIRAGQYGFGFVAHFEKKNVPHIVEGSSLLP